MKRIMNLYESCKTPIKVAYFAFVLITFGYLIQNENVNIFYTFRSGIVLFIAELALKIGEFTIMNLPIIFMLNIVCKKANNAAPVVMALVGYYTFVVATMLLSPQNLSSTVYASGYGINSMFNTSSTRLAIETGMVGAFCVGYATRIAFIFSRHRGSYSITNLLSRDMAGVVYNFIFCFLLGVFVSYAFPIMYNYLQKAIVFIASDLSDPMRIGMYSVLDRVLSILGIGNFIRYPFWYTAAGGSYLNTVTGQSILGDVSIWSYVKDANAVYAGAGRFITPYYVINMFIIPAIYLGTFLSISDRKERGYLWIMFLGAIVMSIIAGNPLPLEMMMLFTSPALLLFYLIGVGIISSILVNFGAYLGFTATGTNTVIAMPGSFPDFVINVRNSSLVPTIRIILIVGVAAFLVYFIATLLYYRLFAFDFVKTGSGDELIYKIVDAVGGDDNVEYAGAGLYKLNIYLKEPERISIEKIQDLFSGRVSETKNGLSFEIGTSAYSIARRINRYIS